MQHQLLFPDNNGSSNDTSNNRGDEIAVVLKDKTNKGDKYDQQINDLQKNIQNSQKIIIEFTPLRLEYQVKYNEKMEEVRNLSKEYEEIKRSNMSEDEKTIFEENKKAEEEMWQHIFDGMGFSGEGVRGDFTSEEDFFQHQQQENKKQADQNYVKKNMSEVTGELVEQLKDISVKDIYRAAVRVLHEDQLKKNVDIMKHEEYYQYLKSVFVKLTEFKDKDDKAAMILTIQEANMRFLDGKFILATYEEFFKGSANIHKKNIIQGLEEQLSFLKQSYVYVFYIKHTTGDTKKELRQLDDKIQELEDLIASYRTTS